MGAKNITAEVQGIELPMERVVYMALTSACDLPIKCNECKWGQSRSRDFPCVKSEFRNLMLKLSVVWGLDPSCIKGKL